MKKNRISWYNSCFNFIRPFLKLQRGSSTEPLKICYLRSNICLWSQCTCKYLTIFVLARRRRAQGWQEFLETAQHKKSTDDCALLTVFCHLHLLMRTTCFFQRDWGAAPGRFSAKISFWCQNGFQSTKEPFLPIFFSQFLSLWDWNLSRSGGQKSFFCLVEVTILLVSIQ